MTDDVKKRLDVVLVAGGKYHDIDFARLELLKLLAEDDRIRTRVYEDYSNLHAISNADFLITYTCDVRPTLEQQKVLRDFVYDIIALSRYQVFGKFDKCPVPDPKFRKKVIN